VSDVFISYARESAVYARRAAEALRSAGFAVWYDDDLPAHRAFSEVIEERLRAAKAVVVLWSAGAVKSEWVRAEADTARKAKTLIQLRVDKTELPLPFSQIQCVDLANWSGDAETPGWRKIIASVEELIGRPSKPRPATPSHSQPGVIERLRRKWPLVGGVAAAVLFAATVAAFFLAPRLAGGQHAIQSIAVLPLDNYSGKDSENYFAEGMTDELTTELATISRLRVISRSSVVRFQGSNRPPAPEIANQLNVDALIEGSVMRAEGQVRITVQLIDARADKHLWAETLERKYENVLSLQDELAAAIARQINVALTPGEKARFSTLRVVNPAAHDAYLKGRYFFARPSDDNLRTAIAEFEEATRLDPTFAAAYSGLADAYDWAGYNESMITAAAAKPHVQAAAEKAVALDPSSAEAHASLAVYKGWYEHDWDAAEREFRTSISLDPSYAYAHDQYDQLLAIEGRLQESVREGERAVLLDPLAPQVVDDTVFAYMWQRNFSKAREVVEQAAKVDPGDFGSSTLGWIDLDAANYRDAIRQYENAGTSSGSTTPLADLAFLGYAYGMSGDRAHALATLAKLDAKATQSFVPPFNFALVYLGLGDKRRALDYLEQAYAADSQWLPWTKSDPIFDPLRHEPRFKALLKKLGLQM